MTATVQSGRARVRIEQSVRLIVVVGTSGVGKTTMVGKLLDYYGDALKLVESLTTRGPRPTDLPGEYRQVTTERLDACQRKGELLWRIEAYGNEYASTKNSIWCALQQTGPSIMHIVPECVEPLLNWIRETGHSLDSVRLIFLHAPKEQLRGRLQQRDAGESQEHFEKRLLTASLYTPRALESGLSYAFIGNGDGQLNSAFSRITFMLRLDERGWKIEVEKLRRELTI